MGLLIRAKRALNNVMDRCVMLLMALLAVVLFIAVIMRYFFNLPLAWSEEVSRYAFVWLSFLGAEMCFRANAHVGVDLLVQTFPASLQNAVRRFGQVLAGLFLLGLLVSGISVTLATSDQLSPALGIPMCLVYGAVPVGTALMLLDWIVQVGSGVTAETAQAIGS